jgi:hypothetical protein
MRVTAAGLALFALVAVAAAFAAEGPSRAEYVATLERLCKPKAQATQKVMRGARAELRAERLTAVARKFEKAAGFFDSTVTAIAAVPRPAADTATLSKWFTYLHRQEAYLKRITAQLRAGHTLAAQRLTARFIHNGTLANNTVLAFGFNWCSFKFSRYE